MAGAAPTPSGKGKKKPLDASLNLVPFIDLMSCCISFLLMAISFGQLSQLKVNQNTPSENAKQEQSQKPDIMRKLIINEKGFTVITLFDGEPVPRSTNPPKEIPLKGTSHDVDGLIAYLMSVRSTQLTSPLIVAPSDSIEQGLTIKVLDVCTNTNATNGTPLFPSIALAVSKPQEPKKD